MCGPEGGWPQGHEVTTPTPMFFLLQEHSAVAMSGARSSARSGARPGPLAGQVPGQGPWQGQGALRIIRPLIISQGMQAALASTTGSQGMQAALDTTTGSQGMQAH